MEEPKKLYELYNINTEEYENTDIESALFSVRVNNRLHRMGIQTVGALLKCTPEQLMELNGFGAGCFKEIYEYLESLQKTCINDILSVDEVKKVIPENFYQNRERIINGDFSFGLGDSDDEQFVEIYKNAQEILQPELAEQCIVNPMYMKMLSKELADFSESISRGKEAIINIPPDRRNKKVSHIISACSSMATGKADLLESISYDDECLEAYIRANALELRNKYSPLSRLVKACCYDISLMARTFFDEIKKNERAYEIVKLRSEGQTLEQVGNEYSVTRERVRQIEKKISQKFVNWVKHNSIILKIVADEDGNRVMLPSVFDVYFKEYSKIFAYLLKINEQEFAYVHYNKGLDIFVVGDESIITQAQEYVEELPDQFNEEKLNDIFFKGFIEHGLSKELICRTIGESFKKTGDVYHRSRLTLGKIYEDVLRKHYTKGIWIYNDAELEGFRKRILEDYGDVKLPENNRALVGRIAAVGILRARGIYGPKKEKYISDELATKIYSYITESEAPIFLTNTIYNVFEEELMNEGIDNKYYLQGILRELYEGEFAFRRDYISKDKNLTSVYSEIVGFIERAEYPVTKRQINEAFPGVTEIVINLSISDPEVINLFGVYIHANKIKLDTEDLQYIDDVIKVMFTRSQFMHCKDIYEYIVRDNPNILTSNGIYQAFGLYSVLEYLYRDELEFSRPYIGGKGVEITRTFDQLHEMVQATDMIQLADIVAVAKNNHFQINSILEFANSCNETHLLINDKELAAIEYIGITKEIALEVERCISENVSETIYISDLQCAHKFPQINVPWTDWLIYSVINKWGAVVQVAVTSTTFKQAQAVVAPVGAINVEAVGEKATIEGMFIPDNLDDIDELISDIVFDEIEG